MTDRHMQAVAGLGLAVGLVVVARQLARSQAPVLGISPALGQTLVGLGATGVLAVMSAKA